MPYYPPPGSGGGILAPYTLAGVGDTIPFTINASIAQTAHLQVWQVDSVEKARFAANGTFTFRPTDHIVTCDPNITGISSPHFRVMSTAIAFNPYSEVSDFNIKIGDTYNGYGSIESGFGTAAAAWSISTTYAAGDRVSYADRDFTSIAGGNIGNVPTAGGDAFWNDIPRGVGLTFYSQLDGVESIVADFTFSTAPRTAGHLFRILTGLVNVEVDFNGNLACGDITSSGNAVVTTATYASAGVAGAIKVGSGLSIDGSGILSSAGGGVTAPYVLNGVGDTIPLTINGITGQTAKLQSWQVNGVEKAYITSTGGAVLLGNVGLGAAPTGGRLHIQGDTHTVLEIDGTASGRVRLSATTATSQTRNFEFQSNSGTFRLSSLQDGWSAYINQYIINAAPSGAISFNSSTTTTAGYNFVSPMANGASAIGMIVDTGVAYTTSAKLLSVRNFGTEKFYVDNGGSIWATTHVVSGATGNVYSGTGSFVANAAVSADIRGNAANSASAVGVILNNSTTLSTTGAKLLSVRNNGTEKFYVDKDGNAYAAGVLLTGGGSGVTSVSGTAPIVSSGGTTPAISITAASTIAAGSMSAADKTKIDLFTSSGSNIGLGGTPNHRLDVRGEVGFYNSGIDGTLGDAIFIGSSTYPTTYRNKIQSSISGTAASSKIVFSLSTGASTYADVLTLLGNGDVTALGNITAYSDARLKTDVQTISRALAKTLALRGVNYTRKSDGTRQMGVIAQEVMEIAPEVVQMDANGVYSVAYGNLVGLLIEAIKGLNAKVEALEARLS